MEKDLRRATTIMESWRFVNLSDTALVLSGNAYPAATAQKLREARDDVAVLYNLLQDVATTNARLEAELSVLRQR